MCGQLSIKSPKSIKRVFFHEIAYFCYSCGEFFFFLRKVGNDIFGYLLHEGAIYFKSLTIHGPYSIVVQKVIYTNDSVDKVGCRVLLLLLLLHRFQRS